ncbi:MAG: DNA polymerase I, partial [Flavobacteriales bacterium]
MENPKEKLFLLDAFALIYRSFFAFAKNPRINSKGENTSAVFGFMNTLLDVIEKEKPKYLAVVFDTSEPTFRHIEYKEYKAQREAMPEGISTALPYIFQLLEAMQIQIVKSPGFEADDVIGTLAWQLANDDLDVYMMTPDKDYAQLVRPNVMMYKPSRMGKGVEIWGVEEVKAKFEVDTPLRVIDYLGMMGDASDNIPGIPGVGDKTAKKFLKAYGSMEGLYENLDQLKGKQKEKVTASKDLAFLSRSLATIKTDVPNELTLEQLERQAYNQEALIPLFKQLEFYSSAKRLNISLSDIKDQNFSASDAEKRPQNQIPDLFSQFENPETTEPQTFVSEGEMQYKTIQNDSELNQMIEVLFRYPALAFSLVTSSQNPLDAELLAICFSGKKNEGFYVQLPDSEQDKKTYLQRLKPLLTYNHFYRVSDRMKYSIQVLSRYDIDLGDRLFDLELAHYLLEPDMKHELLRLSELYLQRSILTLEDLAEKKSFSDINMAEVEQEKLKTYHFDACDVILQLFTVLDEKIKDQGLKPLFEDIEMPLCAVLAEVEMQGVRLDKDALKAQSETLTKELQSIENQIHELAGKAFNISSPKQLGFVLFDDLELDAKAKKTKSGQYSTSEPVLLKLKDKHPIIDLVLSFRGIQKLLSTYVDALPKMVHPKTEHIHTNYRQAVAATGRLSSTNPNLQNIPIRTENGRKVREAFVPRAADYCLLAADYSQVELRLIAHMSSDQNMIDAFNQGSDFHTATACKLFNLE